MVNPSVIVGEETLSMKTSLSFLVAILLGITAFSAQSADWDHHRLGSKYLTRDSSHSAPPGPCVALTAENLKKITKCRQDRPLKTCPKCTVDHDIRRCRFDGKYSINIFPDQTRCEISRYDVTE